jgi:NTE family protein
VTRGARLALLAAALGAAALLGPCPAGAEEPAAAAPARPKLCLVLSGGGARGGAHIGVLEVLEELHVPVDCIVGTSVGSIIGAAYASGMAPAEIGAKIGGADWDALLSDLPKRADRSVYAKDLERARVGSAEVGLRAGGLVLPRGLLVGHELQFFLQSLVGRARVEAFDDLPVPYRAVATDFESGEMVVMSHGDLASAVRASMSVPGAFAPVERDGRLLADGGLVRNLPIDVARSLGAQSVIAVNLGSPLLKRSELTSLVAAAEQTVNILTEQNVRSSLAELGPGDVLVSPDLGEISVSDFKRATEGIPAGVAAARRVAQDLARFAVPEDEYRRWLARQRRPPAEPHYQHVEVDTSGLKYVNPESVRAVVADVGDAREVQAALNQLLGTDDFQRIDGHSEDRADGTTLVLRPIEKSWGPNYLRAGLAMAADLRGDSDFTFYLDHRATWLNPTGLEWRNRLSLGQVNSIETELRLPLDRARRWFVAPHFGTLVDERNFYFGTDLLASYRNRRTDLGLDLGRRFGNLGELRAGVVVTDVSDTRSSGERTLGDVHERIAAWQASLTVDRLDSLEFPQSGTLLQGSARLARRMFGGDVDYDKLSLSAAEAFGGGRDSLLLGATYETALGRGLPLYDAFSAGGFLNLSGYQRDEILATRLALLRAVYRHRLLAGSSLLPGLYVGASLEGADVGERLNGTGNRRTLGGSLFLSADSLLGPFYLGVGYAEGGRVSLYLYVGRP